MMGSRCLQKGWFPKIASIVLFIFLFLYIFQLNHLNIKEALASLNTRSTAKSGWGFKQFPIPSDVKIKNGDTCTFRLLSTEESEETRALLNAIPWPETLPLSPHFQLKYTSDPAHSHVTIQPRREGGQWRVGDELEVFIQICDHYGRPKTYGGDVVLVRLHNPGLEAGVTGQILDHGNGSYSAVLSLLWEGTALVEVTLVHPSEAVSVLHKLTHEQPDRVYFQSMYRSGSVTETTICNVCLPTTEKENLCNHTDPNTGEPWFCYKPKKLDCNTRVTHSFGGFQKKITATEETLFQSGVNMKVKIPVLGHGNVIVLPRAESNASTSSLPIQRRPSGFYYLGLWQALDGTVVRHFNSSAAITQCLKGKVVHMYGDSTIRQWFKYLNEFPDLKEFDLHSSKQAGPFMTLDYTNNILVTYRCHGPPLRFAQVPVSQLRYIANELDHVEGGPQTVIVIGIWSHLSTYPEDVYIRRLINIRKAVVRLLSRAPETKIIIRTANPKALTVYEALTNSDWFTIQREKLLRALFKDIKVHLVDAWEMAMAHQLPHNLHPQNSIVKNMIDVVLSHVC